MRRLNRRGMTLIEVVVAIAIFGIVMVTIFPAVLVLNLMNTFSFERLDTAFIAQEVMEEVIFESRDNTLANVRTFIESNGYTVTLDNTPTRIEYSRSESNYTVSVILTRVDTTTLFNLMVVVSSSTTDIAGDRTQLETIVSLRLN